MGTAMGIPCGAQCYIEILAAIEPTSYDLALISFIQIIECGLFRPLSIVLPVENPCQLVRIDSESLMHTFRTMIEITYLTSKRAKSSLDLYVSQMETLVVEGMTFSHSTPSGGHLETLSGNDAG